MALTSVFALLAASLVVPAEAYWRMSCSPVQLGRIDPIISPGAVSEHVHTFVGPSNVGVSSNYTSLRAATCTSCEIQADKSAYWTPKLYYQFHNGSFIDVPGGGSAIYYLGRGDNRNNIQPFPPGFRMISGDRTVRSYNSNTYTFGGKTGVTYVGGKCGGGSCTGGTWVNGVQANGPHFFGRPVADAVSFNCLADSPLPETPGMVRTDCKNGLRAQLQMPSCWDGKNLYLADQSHVAHLSQIDNGVCPPTHPIPLPHLFYEFFYGVNDVKKEAGGRFVFAMGDPTGYGFHGDFMNGWDPAVLKAAIGQCLNTDQAGQSSCAPLAASDTAYASNNCPMQQPLVKEQVRGLLTKLPGCINVTPGPAPATLADLKCGSNVQVPGITSNPGATGGSPPSVPTVGQVVNGWKYVGCASETSGRRALPMASYTSSSMTTQSCQNFCASKKLPLAGLEYASECYCSTTLDSGSSLGKNCAAMTCSGNGSQYCGGPSLISLWSSTSAAIVPSSGSGTPQRTPSARGQVVGGATYMGCAAEPTNSRLLKAASYTDRQSMTIESCRTYCAKSKYPIFGVEWSQECYCAASLPSNTDLTHTDCNMPCTGNAGETCGGSARLGIFSNPKLVT